MWRIKEPWPCLSFKPTCTTNLHSSVTIGNPILAKLSFMSLSPLFLSVRERCLWTPSLIWLRVSPDYLKLCSSLTQMSWSWKRLPDAYRPNSVSIPSTDKFPEWWSAAVTTLRPTVSCKHYGTCPVILFENWHRKLNWNLKWIGRKRIAIESSLKP